MIDDFSQFRSFPKIARLSREIIISEKIDGTNAQIVILGDTIKFCSRSRFITPDDDNFGFAKWGTENAAELMKLGDGRHYGEWWGAGINRAYGLKEKRFSLFNTNRWADDSVRPSCCHVVPELYRGGSFDTNIIEQTLETLREAGSMASPGFMEPEGIVVYHPQGNVLFKKTLEKDEERKTAKRRAA